MTDQFVKCGGDTVPGQFSKPECEKCQLTLSRKPTPSELLCLSALYWALGETYSNLYGCGCCESPLIHSKDKAVQLEVVNIVTDKARKDYGITFQLDGNRKLRITNLGSLNVEYAIPCGEIL